MADLHDREDWYLTTFQPLLNVLTLSSSDNLGEGHSAYTRSKISQALLGRKDSPATRTKKSASRMGALNPFFGVGPGQKALDLAAELAGTKVYVYDEASFTLVNGVPFRSLRATVKAMPISHTSLDTKLDTGVPFKGYYYFSHAQYKRP